MRNPAIIFRSSRFVKQNMNFEITFTHRFHAAIRGLHAQHPGITYSGSCAWPVIVKVVSAVGALVPGCPLPMERR
jgi:hypothetical protein